MDFDKIEQQLQKIPKEIRDAFFSFETAQKIDSVGKRHDLHIDQIDTLVQETGLTMIGLKPTGAFVTTISKALGIDEKKARTIGDEINNEVLVPIRNSIREQQSRDEDASQPRTEPPQTPPSLKISDIEHVGGFEIERGGVHAHPSQTEIPKSIASRTINLLDRGSSSSITPTRNTNPTTISPQQPQTPIPSTYTHKNLEPPTNLPIAQNHTEVPVPKKSSPASLPTTPQTPSIDHGHIDIIADHLLANPVVSPPEKNVPPPTPTQRQESDPYRELIR